MTIKILSVFGTRPEAIKMAPVVAALQSDARFNSCLVVTAQHREMLDQVLEAFCLRPDHDLNIMEHGQTLERITSKVLLGITDILQKEKPDAVLVHGDTTSTFAAALAAFYLRIPVGHIEAGMRTGDVYQPFPEELNRVLTADLARWHFAPSQECRDHLLREGIDEGHIIRTPHNTVVEALLMARSISLARRAVREGEDPSTMVDAEKQGPKILVTAHRRESWGKQMEEIFSAFAQIAQDLPQARITIATHANPAIQEQAHRILDPVPQIEVVTHQRYLDFVALMSESDVIATDSGGVQEEGPTLGIPVVVLRDKTEYHELLDAGVVFLAGTQKERIRLTVEEVLMSSEAHDRSQAFARQREQTDSISPILETLVASLGSGFDQLGHGVV